jgi:PAS domain S-box-containing protein
MSWFSSSFSGVPQFSPRISAFFHVYSLFSLGTSQDFVDVAGEKIAENQGGTESMLQFPTLRWIHGGLILLLMFCGTFPAFSLDPTKAITQYDQDVWLRQDGLPANSVNICLQTRDGFLWLGTSAGLYRFDGVRFERVPTDPEDVSNCESIATLFEGRDSSLWIGTAYNGVRKLKDGKLHRYVESDGIMSFNIVVVLQSRTGEYWFGTSFGLYRFSGAKFTSVPITPNYITSLCEDSTGRVWVGTHGGVKVYKDGQEVHVEGLEEPAKTQMVTALCTGHNGDVWIGTHAGLLCWKKGMLTRIGLEDGLSDVAVASIYEDRDGNLWVGTNSGGINRRNAGKWSSFTTNEGLSNGHVQSICEDVEGSLWIATLDGLNRLRNVNITPFTSKEGLANDYVSGVAETPDGYMYFLSDQSATITCLKDGIYTKLNISVGPAYVARDGYLWIGQTGMLLRVKGTKITQYTTKDGLPNRWITSISEDNISLLIAFDGVGVRRFINGKFEPLMIGDGQQYTSTVYVGGMYQEAGGALWIGKSCGLDRIQHGVMESFGNNELLAHFYVGSIYDDLWGNLWFGSPRSGLARYRDGKFTFYTTKIGLFSNEVYCVLGDGNGDLWLSSPRGIGKIRRKDLDDFDAGRVTTLRTEVFLTDDGMKTDECFGGWQPAGCRTSDGRLWFATKKGVVVIDPGSFKSNKVPPPVLLEYGIVDKETVSPGGLANLSPGKQNLEFHYTALSYLVPEKVLFRYMLEGYDKNWVDAGARRVAYYTGVPPGQYRFRVIACNNDGIWNEAGASAMVYLAPHFYQTYWFYILCGCLAVLGVFGLIRLRVRGLSIKEMELEKLIQARTKELQEQRSFLRKIIDLNPSFIFAKDVEGRFTLANRALAQAYGATADDLLGKTDADFNTRKDQVDKFVGDDLQVMVTKTEKFIAEEEFTDSEGVLHWMQVMKIPIVSDKGIADHMLGVATDITERKRAEEQINTSLREKEVLLKEIHHRVKNNLQVISSLLSLQAKQITDKDAQVAFEESRRRIRTMAIVHEELYRSRNIADINLAEQLARLTDELMRSLGREGVHAVVDAEPVFLQIDKAIPCGLIVNELVTNAYKHAFPGQRSGTVTVRLHRKDETMLELSVHDDGVGFPPDKDFRKVPSMGMVLVNALTQQLSGTLTLDEKGGTSFIIQFPHSTPP